MYDCQPCFTGYATTCSFSLTALPPPPGGAPPPRGTVLVHGSPPILYIEGEPLSSCLISEEKSSGAQLRCRAGPVRWRAWSAECTHSLCCWEVGRVCCSTDRNGGSFSAGSAHQMARARRLPFAWRFPVSFNHSARVLEWLLLALLAAGRWGGGGSSQHHGWRRL